jgi:TPR repeat protein
MKKLLYGISVVAALSVNTAIGCSSAEPIYKEAVQLLSSSKPSNDDYAKARQLLESVASSKDPAVLQDLGIMLYLGLGGNEDVKRGLDLLEESADLGSKVAQRLLITIYKIGAKVSINKVASGYWSFRFANNLAPRVNTSPLEDKFFEFTVQFGKDIGVKAHQGDQEAELKRELIIWAQKDVRNLNDNDYVGLETLAKKGNVEAQYYLGSYELINYRYGKDAPKNVYWLERAAEKGHVEAMYLLSKAYLFYPFVIPDLTKAKYFAEKLYKTGHDNGVVALFSVHMKELEKSSNKISETLVKLASEIIKKSKTAGASQVIVAHAALILLGKQGPYGEALGNMIEPDLKEGVSLFVRSAEAKYAINTTIVNVARIFEEGKYGQKKDLTKALHYYKKAALFGDKKAIEKVKQLLGN